MKRSIIVLIVLACFVSCGKKFLEEKPDKSLVVPATLSDFQSLMDNYSQVNITPGLIEVASDDFSVIDGAMESQENEVKNAYLWADPIGRDESVAGNGDWNYPYAQILRMNVVLDGLKNKNIEFDNSKSANEIRAAALFYRSYHLFHLLQSFSAPFDPNTANTDLGIKLKLNADVNENPFRTTVKECYDQIIRDLLIAQPLLPEVVSMTTRPSKTAANAFLCRVYLSMSNYIEAEKYADLVLQTNDQLVDFNQFDVAGRFTRGLPLGVKEIIFYSLQRSYAIVRSTSSIVNVMLYNSYRDHDLRKQMYFTKNALGNMNFKGSYDGTLALFSGLAVDEIYLVKAECQARRNQPLLAMETLNLLLKKRWDKNYTYDLLKAENQEEALRMIFAERRKELLFRGIRWFDLRRLNKESGYATSLSRRYNGQIYTLIPNSTTYTFPIPSAELKK